MVEGKMAACGREFRVSRGVSGMYWKYSASTRVAPKRGGH